MRVLDGCYEGGGVRLFHMLAPHPCPGKTIKTTRYTLHPKPDLLFQGATGV